VLLSPKKKESSNKENHGGLDHEHESDPEVRAAKARARKAAALAAEMAEEKANLMKQALALVS
jgi:hypothetical protein